MKASTKTKQPEWAICIAEAVESEAFYRSPVDGNLDSFDTSRAAEVIAQSPHIKELVEALAESDENWIHIPARLRSALKPFKASTGGG